MKTIDYYMNLPYRLEILPASEEGGYVARYPQLPGCITVSETMADAVVNAEDAKRAWIAAAIENGTDIAEPDSIDDYSGQFKIRIPKSLHRSLAEHAKAEGTSMNQCKMKRLTDEEMKIWYINAVKSDLILNCGLLPEEADRVIEAFRLKYLVDKYGDVQMHDSPKEVTTQMKTMGLY